MPPTPIPKNDFFLTNEAIAKFIPIDKQSVSEFLLEASDASLSNRRKPRFTYVIGSNGLGKSRALAKAATHLSEIPLGEQSTTVLCIAGGLYDRFSFRYPTPFVEYLGMRNPSNAVFHAVTDRSLLEMLLIGKLENPNIFNILHKALNITFQFRLEYIKQEKSGKVDLERLIDGRKFSQATFNTREIAIIRKFTENDINPEELPTASAEILLRLIKLRPKITIKIIIDGELRRFEELSSGEQSRILTYTKVISKVKENSLVLIDEPESSLHLRWQAEFHKDLEQLTRHIKRLHVAVATHSPTLVTEAMRHSRSAQAVVLDEGGKHFTVYPPGTLESFDASMVDYFHISTFQNDQVLREIAEAVGIFARDRNRRGDVETMLRRLKSQIFNLSDQEKDAIGRALSLLREMKEIVP